MQKYPYKISIIVPVYNAEKYLHRCIDSIIAQQIEGVEIYLVNDGSTDTSLQICNEYAAEYDEITVINKENEGVSVARQTGLNQAQGEYITFVDSDDWLESGAYKEMYSIAKETNADIVWCGRYDRVKGKTKEVYHRIEENPIVCAESVFQRTMHGAVWNKFFKHTLLEEHQVHFPQGYDYCEDWSFCIQAFLGAKTVKFVDKPLYNYFQHEESILHTIDKKKLKDRFAVFGYTLNLVSCHYKNQFKPAISYDISKFLLEAMRYGCFSFDEIRSYYKDIQYEIDPYRAKGLSITRKLVIGQLIAEKDFIPMLHFSIKSWKSRLRKQIKSLLAK